MDTAFLINSDLEINVEALIHEINFLKTLYTEVLQPCCPEVVGQGPVLEGWWAGKAPALWVLLWLKSGQVKKSLWNSWVLGRETPRSQRAHTLGLRSQCNWRVGAGAGR